MANILKIGIRAATKGTGKESGGEKVYLVYADANIGDDIDQILDASTVAFGQIPDYGDIWSGDDSSLWLEDKQAVPHDAKDGVMEGYAWLVNATFTDGERPADDPKDRPWEWSKDAVNREITIAASTFDTTGYIFPGSDAAHMKNLGENKAFVHTNNVAPEGGVPANANQTQITIFRYISTYADVGAASWEDLDNYVNTVNSDEVSLLDVDYTTWELKMESVAYHNHFENGFKRIKITLTFVADKEFKHVFAYPSAGYDELSDNKLRQITIDEGGTPSDPQLLDIDGLRIPDPDSAPFVKIPILVSGGRNILKAFSPLSIPATIP